MLTVGHGLILVLIAGMAIDHLFFHFIDAVVRWIVQAVGVLLHFLGHKNPAVTAPAPAKVVPMQQVNIPSVFVPNQMLPQQQMQNITPAPAMPSTPATPAAT